MSKDKKTDSVRKGKPGKASALDKPKVPEFDAGVTTKDSAYRDRIIRAVESDRAHPIHHGIKMQAHHLISATGMHLSGLAPKIKRFGYNINELKNLVLLPCTLQGACHLGVQPHRGNHTAVLEDQRYMDDEHPRSYHMMVKEKISDLELGLTKTCPGYLGGAKEIEARLKVNRELDELSAKVLRLIIKRPSEAPLTKLARSFQKGTDIGCGGVDSTTKHTGFHACPVGRNHHNAQGPDQRQEGITFQENPEFKLEVGA